MSVVEARISLVQAIMSDAKANMYFEDNIMSLSEAFMFFVVAK